MWARADDKQYYKIAFQKAGPFARDLWWCGLTYCAGQLTDGLLDETGLMVCAALTGNTPKKARALAMQLVDLGLWQAVDGGYLYPEYLEQNPSAEQVKRDKEAAARRMADMRERRRTGNGRFGSTPADTESYGVTNGVTNGVSYDDPVPVPVPVPNNITPPDPPVYGGAAQSGQNRNGRRTRRRSGAPSLNADEYLKPGGKYYRLFNEQRVDAAGDDDMQAAAGE